jgi:hypothetical protein
VKSLPDILFFFAGVCLLAHMVLCFMLLRRLREQKDLIQRLFAVPNEVLLKGSDIDVKLLRARYYWPFARLDLGNEQLDVLDRCYLLAARITGFMMPACSVMFFAVQFIQAS